MHALFAVGLNTFKETIRNQAVYLVLLFVALLIGLSISFGDWSVFARLQVIQDFGLAAMSVSGLLVSVFIGVGMLGKEISSKTVYHVLTQPIARPQFIIGKFGGLLAVLVLNYLLMTVCFFAALSLMGGQVTWPLMSAIVCIGIEMAVIISAALFFSTFTSPILAALFSIAFYCAGHLNDLLSVQYIAKDWTALTALVKVLYYILPNLEHFNIRDHVVYNCALPHGYTALCAAYGGLYVALFLILSCVIFQKKDL